MSLENETEAAPSLRETLEATVEQLEGPEPSTPLGPVEAAPKEPTEDAPTEAKDTRTAAEKARDDRGRFSKSGTPTPKPGAKTVIPKPAAARQNATPAPTPAATTATSSKAPASWKPAAREKWAALPPEVQQEAVRRERETQVAMQESAEARKNWDTFRQATQAFEPIVRAEGGDLIGAASTALQTSVALRTAPMAVRGKIVADIINTFGIPLEVVNQALGGAPAPQGQQQQGQFRDPRFDAFMQNLEAEKAQRSQAVAQQTAGEVESFGGEAEFFDDVRHDMADILERAARAGRAMSLEDAYNRACKLHPDVSEVLEQRERAQAANASVASTQQARRAAISVKSRPAGPASTPAPTGRRAVLDAAWDAHTR